MDDFKTKENKTGEMLDPTPEMCETPEFKAIWRCVKSWDISVPERYEGYCGATGTHVKAILDALEGVVSDERTQMQHIRSVAEINADGVVNETWKRAYLRLADAADTIDAMVARTIDKE